VIIEAPGTQRTPVGNVSVIGYNAVSPGAASKLNTLVISGSGRSGSTLLLRVLGSLDGFCAIGELNNIWEQSILNNRLCSCGAPFRECAFWSAVMEQAFGGTQNLDVPSIIALRDATVRVKYAPLVALNTRRPAGFQHNVSAYAAILERIYQAARDVSGCHTIVDSSKGGGHAALLPEMPSVQPLMIHLVRDSRATAYSWMRKKARSDVEGHGEFMPAIGARKVALQWNVGHAFAALAARRFAASVVCRYEDFATAPRATLADILNEFGMGDAALDAFVTHNQVNMRDAHCLWGNPDRMMRGVVTIRPELAWQEQLPNRQKREVTLLTLPWLMKYGYVPEAKAQITGQPAFEARMADEIRKDA
jgi:hypothetical protein